MIKVNFKGKVNIHWKVSPYDYSTEKVNEIISKASKKYGIPKDKVKVIPEFKVLNEDGVEVSINKDIIQNIQDPSFQLTLFTEYLKANNITDCDFELIKKIDSEINGKIDYQVYDKFRRYKINWINWSNFLSYGKDNHLDFNKLGKIVLLSGEPSNQSGKTTLAIDLIRFLLFGKTTRNLTQEKIFNKHLSKETQVVVEGSITIDGCEYIIKRILSRPSLDKRTAKSKTTQKVEYYKVNGDVKEELSEFDENLQGENSSSTNKIIKEAIGREADFELIMCVTESTLDDLVNKKDAERGRLLSRWIGLLPIEEKDVIAREKYNSEVKPSLLSNHYNKEALVQEITAFDFLIKELNKKIDESKKGVKKVEKEIVKLEGEKKNLLSVKKEIDNDVLKIDITTLVSSMERISNEGKKKGAELASVKEEIKSIGDVSFSIEEYDSKQKEVNEINSKLAVLQERYKSEKEKIKHLKSSEYCPTCKRKLDNVDNSAAIAESENVLSSIEKEGKDLRESFNSMSSELAKMKSNQEVYNNKCKLEMKASALELSIERLRGDYKDKLAQKKEYEKNKEAIDSNNKVDIEIRNKEMVIISKQKERDELLNSITMNESEIKSHLKGIEDRNTIITKICEEEILVKNWKIYLDMIGKNGISKMVLRKALPIINGNLSSLLNGVCDFDVEVGINQKNEVNFYILKDGVYSDLASGSGYELTASALALRAVLAEMSTIPRCSIITLDEVFGRVAKENYDKMKNLLEKIMNGYDSIINITHLDEFKDFCDSHILVRKENNISKIVSS